MNAMWDTINFAFLLNLSYTSHYTIFKFMLTPYLILNKLSLVLFFNPPKPTKAPEEPSDNPYQIRHKKFALIGICPHVHAPVNAPCTWGHAPKGKNNFAHEARHPCELWNCGLHIW
jgi:hypothetical protein